MINREQKISLLEIQLPQSEVFPKYICDMLLRELQGLAEKQLDLLLEILDEEKRRLSKING